MELSDYASTQKTLTKPWKGTNGTQELWMTFCQNWHSLSTSLLKMQCQDFWHVPLDLRSSLLTTFNTPWGKYRWLRMPFGLKVSGDVFQERLDRVLRLVPGALEIADDIVIHGDTEYRHDGTVLILCETARMNNLLLNSKKM